jgi:predicted aspartyl protease
MPTPLLLLAATVVALPQPDPYAPPPRAGTPERLAYDAELGGAAEDTAIEAWLAKHPDALAATRAMLWHRLCNDYGVRVGGERHIAACRNSFELTGDDKDDLDTALPFRAEPPTTAEGHAIVPLIVNPLGSRSADVTVNGVTLPWFIDTGAEITSLPETTAKRIGVRMMTGSANMGTSIGKDVNGRLGVIDTATIGGVTFRHIQVMVLPDAVLTFANGYLLPGIFGLPAIAATGRIAWLDGGTRLALGSAAPAPTGTTDRAYWHEAGLGVPLRTTIGMAGAQFDSGADGTALRRPGMKLLTPAKTASITTRDGMVGGAGGYVRVKLRLLPELGYTLAGVPLRSLKVSIEDNDDSAGRVGGDILTQLKLLTIDFRTMTLGAEPIAKR